MTDEQNKKYIAYSEKASNDSSIGKCYGDIFSESKINKHAASARIKRKTLKWKKGLVFAGIQCEYALEPTFVSCIVNSETVCVTVKFYVLFLFHSSTLFLNFFWNSNQIVSHYISS